MHCNTNPFDIDITCRKDHRCIYTAEDTSPGYNVALRSITPPTSGMLCPTISHELVSYSIATKYDFSVIHYQMMAYNLPE